MARDPKRTPKADERLILDAGALISISRGKRAPAYTLKAAINSGARIIIPAVVLAETVRGGPKDAPVDRIARSAVIVAADETIGREAGRLLGAAKSSATIDAIIVATAASIGAAILTTDAKDMRALAMHASAVSVHAL